MKTTQKIALLLLLNILLLNNLPGFSQGLFIARIDVSGDGVKDDIYNSVSSITVIAGNSGVKRVYNISSGAWALIFGDSSSIVDLDGIAGAEIAVNTGSALMVITDRLQSTRNYPIAGGWAVPPGGIADLDGLLGAEIAVATGSNLLVITQRTANTNSYMIGQGGWAVATDGLNGISDMDGIAGAEIAISNGSALVVVTQRNVTQRSYAIGSSWSILKNGIQDFNCQPGNDIVIVAGVQGQLMIVHPRDASTRLYPVQSIGTSWELIGYGNYTGTPGLEILINSFTLKRNLLINDCSGSVSTFTGTLPAAFSSFKAYQHDSRIAIEWKVENESGIAQYEIEKSSDEMLFIKVGVQSATGNTMSSVNYSWVDPRPLAGNNFYRVRSEGFDGEIKYTSIVKVAMGKNVAQWQVFPNPVSDGIIQLHFTNQPLGVYKVRLINRFGQVVQIEQIKHEGGASIESVQLNRKVAKGYYALEIISPDKSRKVVTIIY